jgi:hypothetical protein
LLQAMVEAVQLARSAGLAHRAGQAKEGWSSIGTAHGFLAFRIHEA